MELRHCQPDGMAAVGEHDCRGGAWLVDGDDDVAVRHQMLDLERVHLSKAGGAFEEQQHRVASLICCRNGRRQCMGGDVLEVPKQERGLVLRARRLSQVLIVRSIWRCFAEPASGVPRQR